MTTTHRAPRRRLTAAVVAVLVVGASAAGLGAISLASAAPVGEDSAGTSTCTTNSGGYCTVNHGLGRPPEGVLLTPVEPSRGHFSWDQATSASFRVHVQRPFQDRAYVGPVTFSWRVWAAPDPGPTTPPPTTDPPTTTPATTTVPPTTIPPTTTTPAPTTTAPAGACAPVPSSCGYPDATNTGVPTGTTLTAVGPGSSGPGWHFDSRGWVEIDGDGAVFDRKSVAADLNVTGSNVTISNSRIRHAGFGFPVAMRHTTGTKIVDNSIGGLNKTTQRCDNAIRSIYGDDTGLTITGNDVSYCASAVNNVAQGGRIADNYFHDFGLAGQDHVNGIQLEPGGGTLMTIEHNTIFNEYSQTDCIMLANDGGGVERNRTINDNLLAGGGYTFYGSGGPETGQATGIQFTNNRFSRKYYPQSGYWGPVAYWESGGAGNVWSGNTWDDTHTAVNP